MPDNSKDYSRIRDSLKDAAIYGAMADAVDDPERSRDYRRLREIALSLAKFGTIGSGDNANYSAGRFSITLAALKLANKIFDAGQISGFLRRRFRRMLSQHSEEFVQYDLRDHAVESMQILDRLSAETDAEGRHVEHGSLVTRTGALRAAVLGVNDGLVSNAALVLGVSAGTDDPNIVLLAGTVALVSGALSMAAGEYISVVSQRDFNENLVRWERTELLLWREEEEEELAEILEAKGLKSDEAKSAASRIMMDPEIALDMHVREELGIDPDELGGSPALAAISSFAAFAGGAIIPLLPYIVGITGPAAIISSATAAALALAVVGGALGLLSNSGTIYGALRMLAVGLIAGAVTYGLGSIIGHQIG